MHDSVVSSGAGYFLGEGGGGRVAVSLLWEKVHENSVQRSNRPHWVLVVTSCMLSAQHIAEQMLSLKLHTFMAMVNQHGDVQQGSGPERNEKFLKWVYLITFDNLFQEMLSLLFLPAFMVLTKPIFAAGHMYRAMLLTLGPFASCLTWGGCILFHV